MWVTRRTPAQRAALPGRDRPGRVRVAVPAERAQLDDLGEVALGRRRGPGGTAPGGAGAAGPPAAATAITGPAVTAQYRGGQHVKRPLGHPAGAVPPGPAQRDQPQTPHLVQAAGGHGQAQPAAPGSTDTSAPAPAAGRRRSARGQVARHRPRGARQSTRLIRCCASPRGDRLPRQAAAATRRPSRDARRAAGPAAGAGRARRPASTARSVNRPRRCAARSAADPAARAAITATPVITTSRSTGPAPGAQGSSSSAGSAADGDAARPGRRPAGRSAAGAARPRRAPRTPRPRTRPPASRPGPARAAAADCPPRRRPAPADRSPAGPAAATSARREPVGGPPAGVAGRPGYGRPRCPWRARYVRRHTHRASRVVRVPGETRTARLYLPPRIARRLSPTVQALRALAGRWRSAAGATVRAAWSVPYTKRITGPKVGATPGPTTYSPGAVTGSRGPPPGCAPPCAAGTAAPSSRNISRPRSGR